MQGWRSQLPQRISSPALTPLCFAFSSSGVSSSLSRSRSVCADVVVPWILVATIVQRVRERWDGADLQLPASWLFRTSTTSDGCKLLQTVCHCLVAHNWPSTRLWCPRCTAMALRDVVLLTLRCSSRRGQAQEGAHLYRVDRTPSIFIGRAEKAGRLRWASTLACSAARAFAASLLRMGMCPRRTRWCMSSAKKVSCDVQFCFARLLMDCFSLFIQKKHNTQHTHTHNTQTTHKHNRCWEEKNATGQKKRGNGTK